MSEFFASGRAADLILLVLLVEAVILLTRGWRAQTVALALLPGVFFVIALRAALTGAGWVWVALALAAAGLAHVADLRGRGGAGRR